MKYRNLGHRARHVSVLSKAVAAAIAQGPCRGCGAVLGGGRCLAGRQGSGAGGGSGSRSSVAGVSQGAQEREKRGERLPTRSPFPSSACPSSSASGSLPSPNQDWRVNFFCRCLSFPSRASAQHCLWAPHRPQVLLGNGRDEGGRVGGQFSLGLGTELRGQGRAALTTVGPGAWHVGVESVSHSWPCFDGHLVPSDCRKGGPRLP